jgi:hypothetical protein
VRSGWFRRLAAYLVAGPAAVTDGNPAVFDGTTGKLLREITYANFKTALALVKGDVGLGNVDNTSDATKNAAVATLTNKTLTAAILSGTTNVSGGQLAFPAAQSASADANTLDDYEEGTWTPVLTYTTLGDLAVTYSIQIGTYTKIGRQVIASGQVTTSSFTHTTASGIVGLTGLPFTSANVSNTNYFGSPQWAGITRANYTHVCACVFANSSIMNFSISGSGQVLANVTHANMPTGGSVVLGGTVPYLV